MIEEKFYTCKYDRPFKEIFLNNKNKHLLKGLLETILKIKIDEIEIMPTERNSGNIKVKRKIFDALLHVDNKKIGIEVNSNIKDYTRSRNMSYICDVYSHHTMVGESYDEETDIIQINLTYGMKDKLPYRIYKIRDKEEKEYVKNFYIYEINMEYYKKIWYDKKEREIKENKYLVMLDLEEKELEKLSKEDKGVGEYMGEIRKLNGEIVFREYMSEEEDKRKIYNTEMKLAREKGLEEGKKEGIEQGIEQGLMQTAKNMLDMGLNINDIVKATGLEKNIVENLRKQKN